MQQNEGMLSGWPQFWRITEVWMTEDEFWPNFQHCLICLKMERNTVEWKIGGLFASLASEEQRPFPGQAGRQCCGSPFEVLGEAQQSGSQVPGSFDGSFSVCLCHLPQTDRFLRLPMFYDWQAFGCLWVTGRMLNFTRKALALPTDVCSGGFRGVPPACAPILQTKISLIS